MAFTMTFNRAFAYPARGQSAVQAEWRRLNATKNLLKLYRHQIAIAGCNQVPSFPRHRNVAPNSDDLPCRRLVTDLSDSRRQNQDRRSRQSRPSRTSGRKSFFPKIRQQTPVTTKAVLSTISATF
jgi:hypothetical protein